MIQIILLAVLGHRGCSGTYNLLEYVNEQKQLLNCSYYFPLHLHCGLGRTLADKRFFFWKMRHLVHLTQMHIWA